MSDPVETARAVMKEIDIGSRSKIISALADHEVAVRAAAIAETEARYRGLVEAAKIQDRAARRLAVKAMELMDAIEYGRDLQEYVDALDGDFIPAHTTASVAVERALRAIEVAETTSVTEVIEGDTSVYTANDPPIRVN